MANDPIPTFTPSGAEAAFDAARQDAKASAYPWQAEIYDHGFVIASGLTKRELFAAMAMQGLCARPAEHRAEDVIPVSLSMADALLVELAKDSQ